MMVMDTRQLTSSLMSSDEFDILLATSSSDISLRAYISNAMIDLN
jgi:hypothetical protein